MRRVLSMILIWLLLLTSAASARDRDFLPPEFPGRLNGKHFVVYYTTKGEDAITAEQAEAYLKTAEAVYKRLVTEGGMRPPRVEPVPLVVMADAPSLGGAVSGPYLGFDLWLKMNPRHSQDFGMESVLAHEFFHVLQRSYARTDLQPGWAIEGTATIAPFYALDGYQPDRALLGQTSSYWAVPERPLQEDKYQVSLFWYWLADQYGGIKFLDRLLSYAEHLGWERAAQLAAIAGGAPEKSTFDTLWRSFVLAMAEGKMPKGYQANSWWSPARVYWAGKPLVFDRGDRQEGLDPLGRLYAYWEPLSLQPYAFTLVEVNLGRQGAQVELEVTGDSGSVEAYLIKPGPSISAALADYALRPSYTRPAPVPFDPETAGAALEFGRPVRLGGPGYEQALVLLVRLGDWGDGGYALQVRPPGPKTPAPEYQPLANIDREHTSAVSPPPLTSTELASLREGRYLSRVTPLYAEPVRLTNLLQGKWGSTSASLNGREVTLPVAPTSGGPGAGTFPLKAVMQMLGGTVTGNRISLGDSWVVLTPGSSDVSFPKGILRMQEPVRSSGDELLAPSSLFFSLGVYFRTNDQGYTLAAPTDHPPIDN